MRRRRLLLIAAVSTLLLTVACGRGSTQGDKGEGELLAPAVAALSRTGSAAVSVVGLTRSGITAPEVPLRLAGTWAAGPSTRQGTAHLVADGEGNAMRPKERWLLGRQAVVSSFLPDSFKPWTSIDAEVVDRLAAQGQLERAGAASGWFPYGFYSVLTREPSPMTVLELVERARETDRGRPAADGLTAVQANVSARAVVEVFGPATTADLVVDCDRGLALTAWTDEEGRLRRVKLSLDHVAFSGALDVSFDRLGKAAPGRPPAEDEVMDLTARLPGDEPSGPPPGGQVPHPCPEDAPQPPAGVQRDRCPPPSGYQAEETKRAFAHLDRRGRMTPAGIGSAWLGAGRLLAQDEALHVGDGLVAATVLARWPDGQGGMVTAPADVPLGWRGQDIAALIEDRTPQAPPPPGVAPRPAPPANVAVAAVLLRGPWAALAAEASECHWTTVVENPSPSTLPYPLPGDPAPPDRSRGTLPPPEAPPVPGRQDPGR